MFDHVSNPWLIHGVDVAQSLRVVNVVGILCEFNWAAGTVELSFPRHG